MRCRTKLPSSCSAHASLLEHWGINQSISDIARQGDSGFPGRAHMKRPVVGAAVLSLCGCASISTENAPPAQVATPSLPASDFQCPGTVGLPVHLEHQFFAVDDPDLLSSALGTAGKGKLCQGLVYAAKLGSGVAVYRAWNSTNPNSQFGDWWAFDRPSGKVSKYRSDYEICYQWSPLDKMTQCTLKADVKVVVGTGQSAVCSEYLTYPTSAKRQIYIEDASQSVIDCTTFDGEFSWAKSTE